MSLLLSSTFADILRASNIEEHESSDIRNTIAPNLRQDCPDESSLIALGQQHEDGSLPVYYTLQRRHKVGRFACCDGKTVAARYASHNGNLHDVSGGHIEQDRREMQPSSQGTVLARTRSAQPKIETKSTRLCYAYFPIRQPFPTSSAGITFIPFSMPFCS